MSKPHMVSASLAQPHLPCSCAANPVDHVQGIPENVGSSREAELRPVRNVGVLYVLAEGRSTERTEGIGKWGDEASGGQGLRGVEDARSRKDGEEVLRS